MTEQNHPAPARVRPFRPAWGLQNPHAQTIIGRYLRPTSFPLQVERERWELPDGDFLDIDIGSAPTPDAPLGLVVHGLEGNSRRAYVRLAMRELHRAGITPVALNLRGCGDEPNRLPRFYHSAETGDLDWVIRRLADQDPSRRIGIVAFSLGGNILLRYLGEEGETLHPQIGGAVAISVPYDLAGGADVLERDRMGRIYTHYFVRSLQRKIEAKASLLGRHLDLRRARSARTIRAFDEAVTAPLHGFESASDYYEKASVESVLPGIRVPTLLLQADDDPFLPPASVPVATIRSNRHLQLELTPAGGHVGFVEGRPGGYRFWAEEAAATWLARLVAPTPLPTLG